MASPTKEETKITVLISGNGTNLQALFNAISNKKLDAQIIRVISNRKTAFGLERAKQAGIPTEYHNLLQYKKKHPSTEEGVQAAREAYDADLAAKVLKDEPDLICCLGFLHVLSRQFLDPIYAAHVKIINLHPALPGQFNGSNAIERAHAEWLEGKITKTGVMIHEVIPEVDMGTPILVREIHFIKGQDEDIEVFERKLHNIEWGAVVEGIGMAIKELLKEKGISADPEAPHDQEQA
ncbi:hypothetical protein MMC30_003346 [Trapelia coarctata]|nr:hypothetical protein [Trapelia coarctata]